MEDQDDNDKKLYTYDIYKKLTQQSYIMCYEKISRATLSTWFHYDELKNKTHNSLH